MRDTGSMSEQVIDGDLAPPGELRNELAETRVPLEPLFQKKLSRHQTGRWYRTGGMSVRGAAGDLIQEYDYHLAAVNTITFVDEV